MRWPVSILLLAGYTELLIAVVHPLPARLVEYGRFATVRGASNQLVYMGEGLTASVAVSDLPDGIRNYHNAGKSPGFERSGRYATAAHARSSHNFGHR
jgi:hypothetical protein